MNKTAAILIIGDEILSGRTIDANTQNIALELGEKGIEVKECRIIGDDQDTIIEHVNALRAKYDYLFTSGGIGPTHDDITACSISKAMGSEYELNEKAYDILQKIYELKGEKVTLARKKMAMMPRGAEIIEYEPSGPPGFKINNVYVLAGVPEVLKAMMKTIIKSLPDAGRYYSLNKNISVGESFIAQALENIQSQFPAVSIGSYPYLREGMHGTNIVLRSKSEQQLNAAFELIKEIKI